VIHQEVLLGYLRDQLRCNLAANGARNCIHQAKFLNRFIVRAVRRGFHVDQLCSTSSTPAAMIQIIDQCQITMSLPKRLLVHANPFYRFRLPPFQAALNRAVHDAVDFIPAQLEVGYYAVFRVKVPAGSIWK
jgi:hypothetical protein